MKRLLFISTFDYPSRYAHAIHGAYMARAFYEKLGERFLFLVNTAKPGALAGIPHRLLFGRFGRRVKLLHLLRVLAFFAFIGFLRRDPFGHEEGLTIFAIDPALIPMLAFLKRFFGFSFIFEVHRISPPARERMLARAADTIVFITQALKADFLSRHPAFAGRTIVLPEAVDVGAFTGILESRQALRRELALPENETLVGYIGRFEPLSEDKGLRLMIQAAPALPSGTRIILVGGSAQEIASYTAHLDSLGLSERVLLVPHVPTPLVPRYAKACDILAYVPSGGSVFFEKETSPMKLFEYMAAERPIIVSDLPTTREILDDGSAFFVPPGSKEAFVRAVHEASSNTGEASRRVASALKRVAPNTWGARAERIIESAGISL